METVLIVIAAILVMGVVFVLFAVAKAPYGYEDDEGFHKKAETVSDSGEPTS